MPEDNHNNKLPLSDVTIIDLTQVLAGPFATMNLGDLGAEIVKIEAVGRGDRSRSIQPVPEYFDTTNRNKQSIEVNLKTEEGQQIVYDLVRDADVFVESSKPGRVETFNISYDDLREINPELIYCSISGFGSNSPYENIPAWDMLIQAMSGIMSMTGEDSGPPLWSGLPSGDLSAAMYTTQSILTALYARERGVIESEWIEVPMLDAAISWLSCRAAYSFKYDKTFPRLGVRHPSIAPFGVFDCADEKVVIAAGTASLWKDFCSVLDREDLLSDERFKSITDRCENVHELTNIIEDELASDTATAWAEKFQAADVPVGPIHTTKSVWEDEYVEQRGLHQKMDRDGRESADVIDNPIHFSLLETQLATPPEALGESTGSVLNKHGYDEEEIKRLRDEGVIGL